MCADTNFANETIMGVKNINIRRPETTVQNYWSDAKTQTYYKLSGIELCSVRCHSCLESTNMINTFICTANTMKPSKIYRFFFKKLIY